MYIMSAAQSRFGRLTASLRSKHGEEVWLHLTDGVIKPLVMPVLGAEVLEHRA